MATVDAYSWFVGLMREFRLKAGNPSGRAIASKAAIGHSTVQSLLTMNSANRSEPPEWTVVEQFVLGCVRHAQEKHSGIRFVSGTDDPLEIENRLAVHWKSNYDNLVRLIRDHSVSESNSVEDLVRVERPPMLADQYQLRERGNVLNLRSTSTFLLTGLGGAGKTQIAAHYAASRWRQPELRLAMWISAHSRESILASYAQAAVKLELADAGNQEHAAERLLEWLSSTKQRWLIVLDDLHRPEHLHQL